jgi:hypothetical protein
VESDATARALSGGRRRGREIVRAMAHFLSVPRIPRCDRGTRVRDTRGNIVLKSLVLASVAALAAFSATPVSAQVTYTFDGFSDVIGAPQSATFTLNSYLTSDTFIPTSGFTSCVSTTPCAGIQFDLNDPFNGFTGYSLFDFRDGSSGTFYYFKTADVATNGSYGNSEIGFNGARLTVSGAPLAVPEPGAWAMMLAGLAVAGMALRAKSQTRAQRA